MRYRCVVATGILLVSMQSRAFLRSADQGLPVKDGRPVVALVNGEPILFDELVFQLEPGTDTKHLLEGRGTASDLELLDRLITVRLVAHEAAAMGLADLPEIRKQVDVTSRQILREVLMESIVKDVKPDDAAVERVFKDLVREWKTTSLLFQDEASARTAREAIAKGGDYGGVAARAVADKRARTEGDDEYHRQKEYLPEIAEAIVELEVGQVSPVIQIEAGFVIVKVVDVRYPENAEARTEARRIALSRQKQAVLAAQEEALRAQYVVVKKDVLDSLDYSAKEPGIDALAKDARVVAEVKGASPVTVGDLTEYLRMQSFHGGDPVAQGKRLNARKEAGLDATLGRRVLNAEALRLGIDKTDAYVNRVNGYEESLVFDTFVQKVIAPDNKMREEEVRAYYDEHPKEFSYPGMVRLRSLAFTRRGAAEEATEKLRAGTDYGWLAANAGDQVAPAARALPITDGRLVMTETLPAGAQKVLAGSKPGDVRLYATPEGQFYVLAVQDVVPPNAKPYDEVRAEIAKKLYGEKMKKSIEDYAGKLRALSKVEIYLKRVD